MAYLLIVAAAIRYELGIRIHDMAHAEFAGWMSVVLTFPASLIVNFLSAAVLGVRIGDSNNSFVALLACAALINAFAIFMVARRLR